MKARSLFSVALVLGIATAQVSAYAADPVATPPAVSGQTIAVLGIDSDDVQDQADALADALKARARQAPGWQLMEKSPSLGSMTVSLKCAAKPDATCQTRIADALKTDRYVWGVMVKAGGGGQVNVELHLFRRGKPDFVIRETYSDTLKDQNDEKLRGLARRLFEELTGTSAGHVLVSAGTGGGEVIVDGGRHVPLVGGKANIEVASGPHTLEVLVPGSTRRAKQVEVQNGAELRVDIDIDPVAEPPGAPTKPFPTRTVVGGTLAVVGTALAVTSVVFGAKWIGLKGDESTLKAELERSKQLAQPNEAVYRGGDPCTDPNLSVKGTSGLLTRDYCDKSSSAVASSALAIGFGAGALVAGGIGVYLLTTSSSTEAGPSATPRHASTKPSVNVQPLFGTTNGLSLSGAF